MRCKSRSLERLFSIPNTLRLESLPTSFSCLKTVRNSSLKAICFCRGARPRDLNCFDDFTEILIGPIFRIRRGSVQSFCAEVESEAGNFSYSNSKGSAVGSAYDGGSSALSDGSLCSESGYSSSIQKGGTGSGSYSTGRYGVEHRELDRECHLPSPGRGLHCYGCNFLFGRTWSHALGRHSDRTAHDFRPDPLNRVLDKFRYGWCVARSSVVFRNGQR